MGVCGEVRNKKQRNIDGLTTTQSEYIYNQIEKSLCKIICKPIDYGTGFLCNIKYNYSDILPVLITNNNILEEDDIALGKKICFCIGNETKKHQIKIENSRKRYINEKYNITIIEIKETDNLNIRTFLEIDNDIFRRNLKSLYKEIDSYLLYFDDKKEAKYSSGEIKNLEDDNFTLEHTCDCDVRSLGGPLINLSNYKVIGIHKGILEAQNKKIGILLKTPIEEFLNIQPNKKKSSINKNSGNYDKNKQLDRELNKKSGITMDKSENTNDTSKNISKNIYNKSKNKNIESRISNIDNESKKIKIYVKFNNRKEIELIIKDSAYFKDIIENLNNSYFFTKSIKIVDFNFNGKKISKGKTLKENGLKSDDIITVIEK